jgi:flagellar basal-body rod protein FlgG
MIPALWVSKTGLDAQQEQMNVISNNLANVNTTAFKRDRAIFEDLIYQTVRQPGGSSTETNEIPSGLVLGTGVQLVATTKNFTEGNIEPTNMPLDVAIQGDGFFQVLQSDGTIAYTRDGRFQVGFNGEIVTEDGLLIQPTITLPNPSSGLDIARDGTISVKVPGSDIPSVLGQLQIAQFVNNAGLLPIGNNRYIQTVASGAPTLNTPGQQGMGTLKQGFLESSNVNVVEELVNMIETQRAYEMNSKAIQTVDAMLQYINQIA